MYFVYILQSLKDAKLYIGQTNDVDERLKRHNAGQVAATRNRRPFKIIHTETLATRAESMRREKYLKSLKSSEYIFENIIKKNVRHHD